MTFNKGDLVRYSQQEMFDTSLVDKIGVVQSEQGRDRYIVLFDNRYTQVDGCCLSHLAFTPCANG
jgi:hypothetical protein